MVDHLLHFLVGGIITYLHHRLHELVNFVEVRMSRDVPATKGLGHAFGCEELSRFCGVLFQSNRVRR